VNAAVLAQAAGYDGVEVMGSEGYLINQFLSARSNQRDDRWGGSYENRMRFPVEIVSRIRQRVGEKFIIVYRLSMLDLVPGGSSWDETVKLAKAIEAAGVARGAYSHHRHHGAKGGVFLYYWSAQEGGIHTCLCE